MKKRIEIRWGFYTWLIIFCIFNLIVVNGSIFILGKDKSLINYSRDTFLANPSFADSWDPMNRALKVFDSGDDPSIYQKVFFDQKHKFQYPPTSLVVIEVIKRIYDQNKPLNSVMDWISWFCIIGTVIFTVLIFLKGVGLYISDEGPANIWLSAILVFIFCFSFYPFLRAYILGQIQTWLTFLFTLSLWFWLQKRKGITGVCLGIISIIKPQMALYFFWGIIRRYTKFCFSLAGVAIVFLGVSVRHFGLLAHIKYLEVLSFIAQRGETYFPNQSVNGLINRLFFNGNNLDWDAWNFAPPNSTVRLITMVTSSLFIIFALVFIKKLPETDSWLSFVTAGLVFTIASPVAWEHHYGILLPIFALALPKAWQLRNKWHGGLIWLAVSYVLTSNLFLITNTLAGTYLNFLQSYLFFGALILLMVLVRMQIIISNENQPAEQLTA
jgi:alpha-1,2-mannosyltransferase